MRTRRTIYEALCMLLLLMVTACDVNVELCEDVHPHQGVVDVTFDWSKRPEHTNAPEFMFLMSHRPLNSLRYTYRVTTNPTDNIGELMKGPDVQIGDQITMHGGDYNLFCFSAPEALFEDYEDLFGGNTTYNFDSIWVHMRPLDHQPLPDYYHWTDHNAYSSYLVGMDEFPVFSATTKISIPQLANVNKTNVKAHLTPTSASQQVTIIYHCRPKEAGIRVDSIMSELSGIPNNMQISTRRMEVDKTYKVLFRPTFTQTGFEASSDLRVEGHVFVPGVVRNNSAGTILGPGVLQTAIHITYTDAEGNEFRRVLQASINLYHALTKTPSIEYNTKGQVVQARSSLTIEIDNVLGLTRDHIEVSGGIGEDQWHDNTIIEVE